MTKISYNFQKKIEELTLTFLSFIYNPNLHLFLKNKILPKIYILFYINNIYFNPYPKFERLCQLLPLYVLLIEKKVKKNQKLK